MARVVPLDSLRSMAEIVNGVEVQGTVLVGRLSTPLLVLVTLASSSNHALMAPNSIFHTLPSEGSASMMSLRYILLSNLRSAPCD